VCLSGLVKDSSDALTYSSSIDGHVCAYNLDNLKLVASLSCHIVNRYSIQVSSYTELKLSQQVTGQQFLTGSGQVGSLSQTHFEF